MHSKDKKFGPVVYIFWIRTLQIQTPLKTRTMKLSAALIGTMLLAASTANAQDPNVIKKVEKDSVKYVRKLAVPVRVQAVRKKKIQEKIKSEEVIDSTFIITPDYCPPCGMG